MRLCDCERLLFFTTQIVVFFSFFFQILGFLLRLPREVPANGSKQGNFNLVIWLFCHALLFKSFDMEQSSDELQKILEWECEERGRCVCVSLYVIFLYYQWNIFSMSVLNIYIYIAIKRNFISKIIITISMSDDTKQLKNEETSSSNKVCN